MITKIPGLLSYFKQYRYATESFFKVCMDGDRLWVTSHQEKPVNFLGAKLCSNPGRGSIARGKVLEVD